MANFSSASAESSNLVVSMGTSGAVRLSSKNISTDQNMRTFCYPIKEDEYIIGGATNNGAVVMQWLKDSILKTEDTFETLFSHAESISAGSEGLIFLPYILGERAPIYNSKARGVFFGLNIQHQQAHLIRATMEGITFCLYSIGKLLMENTTVKGIHASGGFAKSPVWLQILADVFNLPVVVAETVESSALGAVKLACEALELPFTINQQFETVYKPIETNHLVYKKSFQKFERIYEALKDEMN
ncbi:MAG: FGGY-family carbohydrate kinase [Daejeonella sp.]